MLTGNCRLRVSKLGKLILQVEYRLISFDEFVTSTSTAPKQLFWRDARLEDISTNSVDVKVNLRWAE